MAKKPTEGNVTPLRKAGGPEAEAYAVARRVLGRSSHTFSRMGSKAVRLMQDKWRRDDLVERINAAPQFSSEEKAELVTAVTDHKPDKTKTGPNPHDLEYRNFVICWAIYEVERLGHSNFRARAIVVEVLAEQGDGLGEDSVKNIWDSKTAMSRWPEIVANGWPPVLTFRFRTIRG